MKIAGLVIGIVIMLLSGIVFLICLALPAMSRKVDFEESLIGLIPSAFFFVIGLGITIISAVFMMKGRKKEGEEELMIEP